jgi:hypothetical protein
VVQDCWCIVAAAVVAQAARVAAAALAVTLDIAEIAGYARCPVAESPRPADSAEPGGFGAESEQVAIYYYDSVHLNEKGGARLNKLLADFLTKSAWKARSVTSIAQ